MNTKSRAAKRGFFSGHPELFKPPLTKDIRPYEAQNAAYKQRGVWKWPQLQSRKFQLTEVFPT